MSFNPATFKNEALLDFLVAVARHQENPTQSLLDLSGFDQLEINVATSLALRLGLIRRAGETNFALTQNGLDWSIHHIQPAVALFKINARQTAKKLEEK